MKLLDRPESDIIAVTMPCFGTTDRTRDNAVELAQRLGATLKRIDIGEAVKQHFKDIGQSMEDHSVTFENGQARERTQVLMDLALSLYAGEDPAQAADLTAEHYVWLPYREVNRENFRSFQEE